MKTDKELGKKVNEYLKLKNVETPIKNNSLQDTQVQKKEIEKAFSDIMEILNLDLNDDSLKDTPKRVAKMYSEEIFSGLNYSNFPKCTTVENKMKYDEMVTVDTIQVSSSCEHHFIVIDGFAKVSYIPEKKVLGLSKINRIVSFFSKRPQIQERLTEQIFHALNYILETDNIAVKIQATHFCVKARGIQDVNSKTTTTKLGGVFKSNQSVRMEFLNI